MSDTNIITIAELEEIQTAPDASYIPVDNGTTTNKITVQNFNASSATTSASHALESEGFAVGQQNGTDVTSGSPYYQNNAKYYAGQAKDSKDSAKNYRDEIYGYMSDAATYALNASTSAGTASGYATQALNAKDAAAGSASAAATSQAAAGSFASEASSASNAATAAASDALSYKSDAASSAANAYSSAVDAARSESNAEASVTLAKSYSEGGTDTRSGEDTDNAKYYKEQASTSATAAASSASAAQECIANPPYIGANGNWYVFDVQTKQYVDSGVDASITVSVGTTSTLTPGSSAVVENVGTSTDVILNFGIPKGDTGDDGVSPEVTITAITGGHTVTITDAAHPSGQSFNVMDGSGSGDMSAATYDPQNAVATAGGIPAYVAANHQDITGKADKVSSATSGNFAGLDSNGNLTDSGSKASDFLTSHQDISGKADKVSSATNGNFAGLDANGNLTDSGSKASDFAASSHTHTKSQITDFPTLGTAAALNVASSGNASTSEVVKGNDTRLSDARTPTSHSHAQSDITGLSTSLSGKADKPTVISATLAANATQVVLSGLPSSGNYYIDFYTSVPGLDYTAISVSGTSATLTYGAQSSATTVYAVITAIPS